MSRSMLALIIVAILAGAIDAESAAISPPPAAPPAAAASPPSAALPSASPPITHPPAPSLMTASEPPLAERRAAVTKEIQDISIRYLGSADPEMRAEGRRRMLAIRDPAGAEAIVRTLGIGDEKTRMLACEVLGQMASDDAARLLAKFVLTEESDSVQLAAIHAIQMRTDRAAIQPLVNGLNGRPETMKRAAYALGEIGDLMAALSLVTHLRRAETRIAVVPAPDTPTPSMFNGTIIPYVAGAQVVVAPGGAVGVKPIIGHVSEGTGYGGGEEPTVVRRMYVAWVPQPEIRAALAKIAGQDFVYNPAAWRDWIERALQKERDQARAERPAAQPPPQAPPPPAAEAASKPIPPPPGAQVPAKPASPTGGP